MKGRANRQKTVSEQMKPRTMRRFNQRAARFDDTSDTRPEDATMETFS